MLIGMMVMKNEADRYLAQSLEKLREVCDAIFIADDRSTDNSVDIALEYGMVWTPPDDVPAFLEDESGFREAAWNAMKETFDLDESDWILAVDADEILGFSRDEFEAFVADAPDVDLFRMKIHEVYEILHGAPYERVDGFWGDISGVRLTRYNPIFFFEKKKMGGGSLPAVRRAPIGECDLHILHLGYLAPEDRKAKYERYSSLINNGHNSNHIKSIISSAIRTTKVECCELDNPQVLC